MNCFIGFWNNFFMPNKAAFIWSKIQQNSNFVKYHYNSIYFNTFENVIYSFYRKAEFFSSYYSIFCVTQSFLKSSSLIFIITNNLIALLNLSKSQNEYPLLYNIMLWCLTSHSNSI